jgi:hypothetical protein
MSLGEVVLDKKNTDLLDVSRELGKSSLDKRVLSGGDLTETIDLGDTINLERHQYQRHSAPLC